MNTLEISAVDDGVETTLKSIEAYSQSESKESVSQFIKDFSKSKENFVSHRGYEVRIC